MVVGRYKNWLISKLPVSWKLVVLTTVRACRNGAYCNLLCFLGAPSLFLILSLRRALFSGSKAGNGLRNKVQFHDMLCNCLYVCYVHNDQNQFLLPRNGPSNLILDWVAIWQFLVTNLSEYRTMHDWNQIALLHPCFVNQWPRLFFVQFCNFTIFVQFLIGRC